MKKYIYALVMLILFATVSICFADRESDLMNTLGTKRLQIQNLQEQLVQARQEEQQLIGMIKETRWVKAQEKEELPKKEGE